MTMELFQSCFPSSTFLEKNTYDFGSSTNSTNISLPSFLSHYQRNATQFRRQLANSSANHSLGVDLGLELAKDNATTWPDTDEEISALILRIFRSVISVFGLLGNLLTLVFLSRKRVSLNCHGAERTVHNGLTALAVSDFLFCLILVPYGFVKNDKFAFAARNFHLIYVTYSQALVNFFIMTSTWLTVVMAGSRYLAICHPFRFVRLLGTRSSRISLVSVVGFSFSFNLPRLFVNRIETIRCADGGSIYVRMPGILASNSLAYTVYIWMHFTVGILAPLVALAFCNTRLVGALRGSNEVRRQYRVSPAHIDSNYRITSVLVMIVVMYIVLVSPAEILLFIQDRFLGDRASAPSLVLAVEVTNLLQMVNFSLNFVLYFNLNSSYRQVVGDRSCFACVLGQEVPDAPQGTVELQQLNQIGKMNLPLPS